MAGYLIGDLLFLTQPLDVCDEAIDIFFLGAIVLSPNTAFLCQSAAEMHLL